MQVRFKDCDDEALLHEILASNPFQADHGTKTAARAKVAATLERDVDASRCREHCTLLISDFKTKMVKSAAASGIDEEHNERDNIKHRAVGDPPKRTARSPDRPGYASWKSIMQRLSTLPT
ncbi:unnamed protein product [Phytophthora fragariaefolia]|uniref:Unnamed protein product n=1 Tax=Phytophthora fragariaefolia TaxID=1490495 RepID=A0A9W6WZZ2_9STRA|nr:unnamed protein product [Phytophthora fragariaefolia]